VDASRNPGCLSSAPRRTTRSTLGAFSGQRRRRGGELRQVRLDAAIGAAFDLRQLRCDGPSFECHAVQRRAGEREWEMEVETRPRAPTSTWPAIGCRARRIRAVISGCSSSGASERADGGQPYFLHRTVLQCRLCLSRPQSSGCLPLEESITAFSRHGDGGGAPCLSRCSEAEPDREDASPCEHDRRLKTLDRCGPRVTPARPVREGAPDRRTAQHSTAQHISAPTPCTDTCSIRGGGGGCS